MSSSKNNYLVLSAEFAFEEAMDIWQHSVCMYAMIDKPGGINYHSFYKLARGPFKVVSSNS
jgi:hypothetical protein